MSLRSVFTLFLIFAAFTAFSQEKAKQLDKSLFYSTMKDGNLEEINGQLVLVQKSSLADKSALEGGLLMKKAGKVSKAGEKLRLFKAGRNKLEALIKKSPDNAEYRFLRLMIQENAPKILGYDTDLRSDKEVILKSYKSLPADVKEAVQSYSRVSKILTPGDL